MIALSNIRDGEGRCPPKVQQFLLDLLRFNDNTGNVFSDNYYVSTLVAALGHSLIPGQLEIPNFYEDDEDEFDRFDDGTSTDVLEQAVREIDRYRTLDYLMPTYHNSITISCLQASMRLMMAGIIPKDLTPFMIHSRFGNFINVRLASFDALLLLGALDDVQTTKYLCSVIGDDPVPYVRFHVAQSLAEVLGVLMAHDGLDGRREMQESLLVEEDGVITGHEFPSYEHDKPDAYVLDVARRMYGQQPMLRSEVWRVLTSNPYLEHRVLKYLLLFCDILYPPGESILHKLKFRAPTVEEVVMSDALPVVAPAAARTTTPAAPVTTTPIPPPVVTAPPPAQPPSKVPAAQPVSHPAAKPTVVPAKVPRPPSSAAPLPAIQHARELDQIPAQSTVPAAPLASTPVPTPASAPVPAHPPAPKPSKPKTETPKPPKPPKVKAPPVVPVLIQSRIFKWSLINDHIGWVK